MDCSGEKGGAGVTAGVVPRIWQQEGSTLRLRGAPSLGIPSQQVGLALDGISSMHAEAGMALHRTTAANTSNAAFL
jgi:hypothetical protein